MGGRRGGGGGRSFFFLAAWDGMGWEGGREGSISGVTVTVLFAFFLVFVFVLLWWLCSGLLIL